MADIGFYYTIGNYRILLENTLRSEVLSHTDLYPAPFAPNWCLGLGSVRGDICLALNMHELLAQAPSGQRPTLLWLQTEALSPVLIRCDALPRSTQRPSATQQIERPPNLPGWVNSVWQDENGLLLELAHGRLFRLLIHQATITPL